MAAMFGWFSEASSLASLSNRCLLSSPSKNSSGKTLTATSLASLGSLAR